MALLGFSGSSNNPTKVLVNWSMTPAFSKYFLNSSFLLSVVYNKRDKDIHLSCKRMTIINIRVPRNSF